MKHNLDLDLMLSAQSKRIEPEEFEQALDLLDQEMAWAFDNTLPPPHPVDEYHQVESATNPSREANSALHKYYHEKLVEMRDTSVPHVFLNLSDLPSICEELEFFGGTNVVLYYNGGVEVRCFRPIINRPEVDPITGELSNPTVAISEDGSPYSRFTIVGGIAPEAFTHIGVKEWMQRLKGLNGKVYRYRLQTGELTPAEYDRKSKLSGTLTPQELEAGLAMLALYSGQPMLKADTPHTRAKARRDAKKANRDSAIGQRVGLDLHAD